MIVLLTSHSYFSRSTTLTIVSILVNIMAPSTRQIKRSSEEPGLAGPQQKRKSFRRSNGDATPSPVVDVPDSAKKHRAEPDAGKPSLIVTIPCPAKEHFTDPDAGATPSLIVTFPYPAKEHSTTSDIMGHCPTKAPRGRTPRTEQKGDQQNNSLSIDSRPKSWGLPEVWAKVFHNCDYNRELILKNIA